MIECTYVCMHTMPCHTSTRPDSARRWHLWIYLSISMYIYIYIYIYICPHAAGPPGDAPVTISCEPEQEAGAVHIYIYIYIYTYIHITIISTRDSTLRPIPVLRFWISEGLTQAEYYFKCGILRPIGNSLEMLRQLILVGMILLGRLGLKAHPAWAAPGVAVSPPRLGAWTLGGTTCLTLLV